MPVEYVKWLEKASSTEEVSGQNGRWTQMNVLRFAWRWW